MKKISARERISESELIRRYIERGLMIEKSKEDIDFIRKNIREEIEIVNGKYFNRIIKLLIKIGTMTITMCYCIARLLHSVKFKDNITFEEMLNEAKREAAVYLHIKDDAVDEAFEFYKNS